MQSLSTDLVEYCCDFLSIPDLIRLSRIFHVSKRQRSRVQERARWITTHFPKDLINTFKGLDTLLMFPMLTWDDKFMGGTDYIDRLGPGDICMMGIDCGNRPFIALRTLYKERWAVDVFFQRYSTPFQKKCVGTGPANVRWACAKYGSGFTKSYMNVLVHEDVQENIARLLAKEPLVFWYHTVHQETRDYISC